MVKDSKKKKQTRHTSPSLLCLYLSGPLPLLKIPQTRNHDKLSEKRSHLIPVQQDSSLPASPSPAHLLQRRKSSYFIYILLFILDFFILDLLISWEAPHKILNSFLGYNNARFTCCLERDPFVLLDRVSFFCPQ